MTIDQFTVMMRGAGATALYAKPLAPNDNSRNQVYLGPDFAALNVLPHGAVDPDADNPRIFKAPVNFAWIAEDGATSPAPHAQLILYPQYPEVRLGSLLMGSRGAPAALFASRDAGRVLFLGIRPDGQILAHLAAQGSQLKRSYAAAPKGQVIGVFTELLLNGVDPRAQLIAALRDVHDEGWVNSERLDGKGNLLPCNAENCGGFTLEAKLGISPNGVCAPDYHGWELKTHQVTNAAAKHSTKPITLMTPEPTGGLYTNFGGFIRRFGNKALGKDRYDFTGRHFVCQPLPKTGLHLVLQGFDAASGKITDATGGIALLTSTQEVAAIWHYTKLLTNWNKKHAAAAYVICTKRDHPRRQYKYGQFVRLGEKTDFIKFLSALAARRAYYDPGCNLEGASTSRPTSKKRNQFRIASNAIDALYETVTEVDLLNP